MKKVVFFNYYHNGDIHVSRGFVRHIIDKVKQIDSSIEFFYAHRNAVDLINDIPDLKYDSSALSVIRDDHANPLVQGDNIYINTWYAQQHFRYMNRYGITMDSLYSALDDSCKSVWGFSLKDISDDPSIFYPTIDYSKYQIGTAKLWLDKHPEKKIFVANGHAQSGQAHNFTMSILIEEIARRHPDKTFILSNQESSINLHNVFQSSNIINKNGSDLNENAFITEYCDTIIGRASGVFTFALTQNNVFKRQCKFLVFSNLVPKKEGKFWLDELLHDRIQYKANFTTTNENDSNKIKNLMETYL